MGLDRAEDPQGGGVGMLLLGGMRAWKAAGSLRNAGGAVTHAQPRRGGRLCAHPRAFWPGPGCVQYGRVGGRHQKSKEERDGKESRAASGGNAAEVKMG